MKRWPPILWPRHQTHHATRAHMVNTKDWHSSNGTSSNAPNLCESSPNILDKPPQSISILPWSQQSHQIHEWLYQCRSLVINPYKPTFHSQIKLLNSYVTAHSRHSIIAQTLYMIIPRKGCTRLREIWDSLGPTIK